MVKTAHHAVLGAFFLNHPPVRRFRVDVTDRQHPLTRGLPESFEVADELYLIELQHPETTRVLLTTPLEKDPSPAGFGFVYERDTSALADGRSRPLGFTREVGAGAVAYVALGHCHSPACCDTEHSNAVRDARREQVHLPVTLKMVSLSEGRDRVRS